MSSDNESYRIDNSDDVSFRDSLSKKRVAFGKQRRTLRQEKKELRKSYKEILNQLNNSADRRKLKDEYQSAIKDVDTRLNNLADKNKQGIDNDVHSGIDSIQSDIEPEEFTGLDGVEVLWADGTYTYIEKSSILDTYNNENYWSIAFDVTSNTFDKTYEFDSTQDQWDDTGTDQTVYRLRVITFNESPVLNSVYGQYRESIICRNGEPVTVLTKSS